MGILILLAVIAVLVLGLERNARRSRRQFPVTPHRSGAHERRDRDAERALDELRARV